MSEYLETNASNGELVVACKISLLGKLIYATIGHNKDMLDYEVSVWPEEEPPEDASLEELAPLHLEFHETWEDAEAAYARIQKEIDLGTMKYNPPASPSAN